MNAAGVEWRVCVAQDGTQVGDDEYLATLPPQTLLVLLQDEEEMVTGMFTAKAGVNFGLLKILGRKIRSVSQFSRSWPPRTWKLLKDINGSIDYIAIL